MDHVLPIAERPGTTLCQAIDDMLPEVMEKQARIKNTSASAKAKQTFNIPAPVEVPDSDEDAVLVSKPLPQRSRSSKTSTARKIIVPAATASGEIATVQEPVVHSRTARRQNRPTML